MSTGGGRQFLRLGDGVLDGARARGADSGVRLVVDEADAAAMVGAERHGLVENLAELRKVAHAQRDRVGDLEAEEDRRRVLARRTLRKLILRIDREAGGLQVAGFDAGVLHGCENVGHGLVVGVQRLAGRLGVLDDAEVDQRHVRRHLGRALSGDDDGRFARPCGLLCLGSQRRGGGCKGQGEGDEAGAAAQASMEHAGISPDSCVPCRVHRPALCREYGDMLVRRLDFV